MATIHRITIHKWFNDPDNHDSVVSHLEPDILDSKLKQALGSITMSKVTEADGISAELFKILKDNAIKVLHTFLSANWEISVLATGLETGSLHSNPKDG